MPDTILLVDDDLSLLDTIGSNLVSNKFKVLIAYDVDIAIEMLMNNTVNLLISDVEMPGKDGFDLVDNVRKIIKYRKLPIILMAENTDREVSERCSQYGIQDVFKKPVKFPQILGSVTRILNKSAAPRSVSRETREKEILSKLSLLIVDDEENLRKMLNEFLESQVKFVGMAGSFEEAQAVIGNHSFDIIITDVKMPDKTGFDLVEWINEVPELAGMPVMMMSGVKRDISSVKRAKQLWIDKYLAKPFDLSNVRSILLELGLKKYRRNKLVRFKQFIADQEVLDQKEEQLIATGQRRQLFQLKKESNILTKRINRYVQGAGSLELFELIEQKSKIDSKLNIVQEDLSQTKKLFFTRRKLSAMIKRVNVQRLERLKE